MATRPVTSAPPEAVLSAAPAQSGPARPGAIAPDNVGNPVLIVPPHRPVATEWRSSHYPAVWAGSQGGNALRLRLVLTPVTGSLGVGRAKAETGWSGGKRRRETGTRAGRGRRRETATPPAGRVAEGGHTNQRDTLARPPRERTPVIEGSHPNEPTPPSRDGHARELTPSGGGCGTDPRHRDGQTDIVIVRRPRQRTHVPRQSGPHEGPAQGRPRERTVRRPPGAWAGDRPRVARDRPRSGKVPSRSPEDAVGSRSTAALLTLSGRTGPSASGRPWRPGRASGRSCCRPGPRSPGAGGGRWTGRGCRRWR